MAGSKSEPYGSHEVDWMTPERSYPGAFRFPKLTTIAMVESRIERGDKIETERRSYISSRILPAKAFADAVRSHWAIENNLHWTLDMTFKEDQSRLRVGHGAKNMAIVRHFALHGPANARQAIHQAAAQTSLLEPAVPAPILGRLNSLARPSVT